MKNIDKWIDSLNVKANQLIKIPGPQATQMSIALQAFIQRPKTEQKKMLRQIQAVSVSTDFAQLTKDAFNITIENENFDMGWEKAFKQVTLGRGQDSWEIPDVANGLQFRKYQEGQRVRVEGMSGSKVTAYVDYYAGALGWTDKMIRFRKIPSMISNAETFRNKFWSNKADNHYLLLAAAAALAGQTTAWQGAAALGEARRDILTFNQAAFDLTNRLRNKGYGDMATAPLLVYANPFDEERIEAVFKAKTSNLLSTNAIGREITRRKIDRIYTYTNRITAGFPIMVLPGRKFQKADAMAPTTFTGPIDILTLNHTQAVWAIYGAVAADGEQAQTVTLG
jgi:hypothetical protein